jgi:hypothetical protein
VARKFTRAPYTRGTQKLHHHNLDYLPPKSNRKPLITRKPPPQFIFSCSCTIPAA